MVNFVISDNANCTGLVNLFYASFCEKRGIFALRGQFEDKNKLL